MIYPMMIKVDFKSVKYISKNPKGLFVTWIVNCKRLVSGWI
jgi:ACR3 family arsenite transporter